MGLTESDPATLGHPQGDAFGQTRKLRPFVYWDIMRLIDRFEKRQPLKRCERRAVRSWFSYRRQVNERPSDRRVAVMVSFSGRASPAGDCKTSAPDPGRYHRAIRKFLNDPKHRFVRRVEAWNEPDLEEAGTRNKPKRAADYWTRANQVCHPKNDATRCNAVVAGAFAGTAGERMVKNRRASRRPIRYRETYRARIFKNNRKRKPLVWSFHAWSDIHQYQVNRKKLRYKAPIIGYFRRLFSMDRYQNSENRPPAVWLSEIGAPYRHDCSKLTGTRPKACGPKGAPRNDVVRYGQRRQRNTAAFLFRAITRPIDRFVGERPIRRVYYYNLVDQPGEYYSRELAYSGRCAQLLSCARTDSGLVGSQVDDKSEAQQDIRIGDYREGCRSLSSPGQRRLVFGVIKKEGRLTRPIKEPGQC